MSLNFLSERIASVWLGRMLSKCAAPNKSKVANTIAAIGPTLLRAYEADRDAAADVPPKSNARLVYGRWAAEPIRTSKYVTSKTGMPIKPPASESRATRYLYRRGSACYTGLFATMKPTSKQSPTECVWQREDLRALTKFSCHVVRRRHITACYEKWTP